MTQKEKLLAAFADAVSDVCYYDRKGDAELTSDNVRQLIQSGEVTRDEIIDAVWNEVKENFKVPEPKVPEPKVHQRCDGCDDVFGECDGGWRCPGAY